MNLCRLCILILLSLWLAGCAPRMAQMPELPNPPQRITQHGYSFMPLAETGWRLGGRNRDAIILGKRGPTEDETVVIMAGNAPIPASLPREAFEAYIRQQIIEQSAPADRYTLQSSEVSMVTRNGAECARTHVLALDKKAKKRSGKSGDMVLEIMQLSCQHPDAKALVTYLGYSQRYYPGNRDPRFDDKAAQLLESLALSGL